MNPNAERVAECRREFQSRFWTNSCPTTLLLPGEIDAELRDKPTSRFGGIPSSGASTTWPGCRECGVPMQFLVQTLRDEHEDLNLIEDCDFLQLFWCSNGCYEVEGDWIGQAFQEGAVLACFGRVENGTRPVPDDLAPLPARPMARRRVEDRPCGFEASVLWWGESYVQFRRRYDDETFFAMSDELDREFPDQNPSAPKLGGLPSWRQEPQLLGCESHLGDLWIQYVSEDLNLTDAGAIYLLGCPCGVVSIKHDFC